MDPDGSLSNFLFVLSSSDTSSKSLIINIVIVLVLIFVNGFFSASEMAIVSMNKNRLQLLAQEDKKFAGILKMVQSPGKFLATIQVGVTFAGFLSSAFAGSQFGDLLYEVLDPKGNNAYLHSISLILVTIIVSYLSLVFGELVPKQIALHSPEKVALAGAKFIRIFNVIVSPFTFLLNVFTNFTLKLLNIDPSENKDLITEEELRMMIDASSISGEIETNESKMIQNIFEFNDKTVSEIMVHRKHMVAMPLSSTYEELVVLGRNEGYTRIPIFEDDHDNIVGILNIKELLAFALDEQRGKFELVNLLRKPVFIHEGKDVDDLFRELQKMHESMAIVIDEYGGVAGLITMEDLIEEIVGNIQDEYDDEMPGITHNADGSYTLDGLMTLDDLVKNIAEFSYNEEDADYDTIAGLVLHLLDRIPNSDECPIVKYNNYDFHVLEMDDKRIAKIQLKILPVSSIVENENDGKTPN